MGCVSDKLVTCANKGPHPDKERLHLVAGIVSILVGSCMVRGTFVFVT
jgi:hypothetical protein